MTSCNKDSASLNCLRAARFSALARSAGTLAFRALGIAGDQLIELGDRLGVFALLAQDPGAQDSRALGLLAAAWRARRSPPPPRRSRRHGVEGEPDSRELPPCGGWSDSACTKRGELVLCFLDAVRLDQGEVGQDLGFAKLGCLERKRLAGRFGRGFLEQLGRLGQLPARFTGLGQLKARRLAIVADRLDLVGRHARGRRTQHDHDFARRLAICTWPLTRPPIACLNVVPGIRLTSSAWARAAPGQSAPRSASASKRTS